MSPSNCECECDKSYDAVLYLDYKNCKCRKDLIDKLVQKCNKEVNWNEMIYNYYGNVCNSCEIYVVLFVTASF